MVKSHVAQTRVVCGSAASRRGYQKVFAQCTLVPIRLSYCRFDLRLGPAVDTGRIYDKDHYFGSGFWLTDLGMLLKARVLHSVTIILSYGKDLQTGRNAFYVTISHPRSKSHSVIYLEVV
jgi:hypothetical protein